MPFQIIPTEISALTKNSNPQQSEGNLDTLSQNLSGELRVTEHFQSLIVDLLHQILIELKIQSIIQHTTLNSRDDLDKLRNDAILYGLPTGSAGID